MAEKLTDEEIALLCDIVEADPTKFTGRKRKDLDRLTSIGYVEQRAGRPDYKLTAKGAAFLAEVVSLGVV